MHKGNKSSPGHNAAIYDAKCNGGKDNFRETKQEVLSVTAVMANTMQVLYSTPFFFEFHVSRENEFTPLNDPKTALLKSVWENGRNYIRTSHHWWENMSDVLKNKTIFPNVNVSVIEVFDAIAAATKYNDDNINAVLDDIITLDWFAEVTPALRQECNGTNEGHCINYFEKKCVHIGPSYWFLIVNAILATMVSYHKVATTVFIMILSWYDIDPERRDLNALKRRGSEMFAGVTDLTNGTKQRDLELQEEFKAESVV